MLALVEHQEQPERAEQLEQVAPEVLLLQVAQPELVVP